MPTTITDRQLVGGDFKVWTSAQTTKGAINASPVFTAVRRTSGRAKKNISYTQSAEVSLDFNAARQVQDTKEISAEIETEVTKQSIGFLLSAIHGTETLVSQTATTISATGTGLSASSGTPFASVNVGDFIFVTGFAASSLNRTYLVTAKASGASITTYPAPAVTEAAGASVTVKCNRTINANTPTYYAMQNRVADDSAVGDVDYYTPFDGIIDSQSLSVGETGIITSSLSMMFEKDSASATAISGQTDAAETTDAPLSAVQNVANWYFGGASVLCVLKSATINVNNNYQRDDAAGCVARYGRGQFEVTVEGVSRSSYADSMNVRDIYCAGTRTAFGVEFDHGGGDKTVVYIPQGVLTAWDMDDGQNVISNDSFSFAAEKSSLLGYTIAVFRNWQ